MSLRGYRSGKMNSSIYLFIYLVMVKKIRIITDIYQLSLKTDIQYEIFLIDISTISDI